ncbi:hypothetical protein QAD02_022723 [Eretmocerus hayati]|uniref:Uncharacterized protein n=1 Tax=Eretmocerus hayati TaxID=131215 RepID=A0ACC2PWB8_9HYME|nr:hypothetical protein QAD02_022723 [Eretmocerus hayati]
MNESCLNSACYISLGATQEIPALRIYKGRNATIQEFPYQISLETNGRFTCGGSIISRHHVITAGHCVDSSNLTVRAGSSYRGRGGSVHKVLKVIRHENYVFKSYYSVPENDIAILFVKEPFKFDKTRQPVSIFNRGEESLPGSKAVLSGWGKLENGLLPEQLQTIEIPVVSKKFCHIAYVMHGGLFRGQICVLDGKGGTSCNGDSGGPLVIDGRLAGLVSGAHKCGHHFYPAIFTEIGYFRDWIDEKLFQ